MYDTSDSTSKITPPFFPLKVERKPPERKRARGKVVKKSPEREKGKAEGNSNRGRSVDVRI